MNSSATQSMVTETGAPSCEECSWAPSSITEEAGVVVNDDNVLERICERVRNIWLRTGFIVWNGSDTEL